MNKPKQKIIKYATIEDRNKVISNLNKMKNEYDRLRNQAIVYMLFGSGVRISELIGLDISDLHISENKPYIHVYRKGGDTDNVPISTEAKVAMEEYMLVRDERVDNNNKHIVFLSEKTDPNTGSKRRITENSVNKLLKVYSNGTITPHMFRKGLGMIIGNAENGGFSAVAQQLGNSATTVQRYYSRINDDTIYGILDDEKKHKS
jgi:integrase